MRLEDKIFIKDHALINNLKDRNINGNTGYKAGEPQEYGLITGILLLGFAAYHLIRKKFGK